MSSQLIRLAGLALFLALPATALAVELSPEVVPSSPMVERMVEARVDYSAAWEHHLRSERAVHVAHLRAYAAAGVFPRKRGEPGWHHQFLDADGNPCAVASLIMTSGRPDLVRDMSLSNNAVVVSELDDGPIVDWVLTSGLTMEEISIIQEPGFEQAMLEPIVQPIAAAPVVRPADRAEQRRLERHLSATLALIEADTESSIWKSMTRLGEKRFAPPPGMAARTSVAGL